MKLPLVKLNISRPKVKNIKLGYVMNIPKLFTGKYTINENDMKRHLLMSIKNMLVNDLGKYKYIKIELAQDDELIMVFYFNDNMFYKKNSGKENNQNGKKY